MQLTVREAARLLAVSEETVYRWIGLKEIPVCRVGDDYRFNRSDLLEWAMAKRIPVSPELFEADNGARSLPNLADALRAGGIVYGVEGADKAAVLHAVAHAMKLPEDVDPEFLYQVLMAREKLGSTGIGDGIAIPHARNPIVLSVEEPRIQLSFLARPIDFGAVDGQPVTTMFTMVSPTIRVHLHLLSYLGFVLRDEGVKAVLKKRAPAEEILAAVTRAGEKPPGGKGKAVA